MKFTCEILIKSNLVWPCYSERKWAFRENRCYLESEERESTEMEPGNRPVGRSCAETHRTTHIKTNIRSITDGRNGKSQNHIWKSSCFICCLSEARSRLVSQAETEPTLKLRAASDSRVILLVPQPPKC